MGRGWVHGIREASASKKGKLFTKIAKEISVAVRTGGSKDPNANSRLRLALREAQKASMPKDTVDRAIKRGSGESAEGQLEEVLYEAYGANGVPVLVEALTDNRNRTVQDLRAIFVRGGGALGAEGSVAWNFDRVGAILAKDSKGRDAEEAAINAGADNVEALEDGLFQFICALGDLETVQEALIKEGWEVSTSELIYKAKTPVTITPEQEVMLEKLNESLDDHDDVKRVHFAL
ncbi:MAG: YebC/PmpR family DNA-binding transcriptional regulator [Bdellovibrionota bacterium]